MDSIHSLKSLNVTKRNTPSPFIKDSELFQTKIFFIESKNKKNMKLIKPIPQTQNLFNKLSHGVSSPKNNINFNKSQNFKNKDVLQQKHSEKVRKLSQDQVFETNLNDINSLVSCYHINPNKFYENNELSKNIKLSETQRQELWNKYHINDNPNSNEITLIKSVLKNNKNKKKDRFRFLVGDDEFFQSPEKSQKKLKLNQQICSNVTKLALKMQTKAYERDFLKIINDENKIELMPNIRMSNREMLKRGSIIKNQNENNFPKNKSIEKNGKFLARDEILYGDLIFNSLNIEFMSNKPNARAQSTLVSHNDKLYLFGGINNQSLNDIWVCNLNDSFKWRKLFPTKDLPLPRYGHTSIVYKDEIYIFGGLLDIRFQARDDIVIYNTHENQFLIDEKCTNKNNFRWRRNHICEIVGQHMVVYGGLSNDDIVLDDIWALELTHLRWNQIIIVGNKPPSLAYSCSTLVLSTDKKSHPSMSLFKFPDIPIGGRYGRQNKSEGIFIFGGIDDKGKFNSNLYLLKIGKTPLTWHLIETQGNAPEGLLGPTINYFEQLNVLVLFGGKKNSQEYSNNIYLFDLDRNYWIQGKFGNESPKPRSGHVSIITSRKQLLIMGGIDEGKYIGSDIFAIDLTDFSKNQYSDFLFRNRSIEY